MFKLLLPVLFPSWRFFSSIGPSPRIYIAFLDNENAKPLEWIEFRSRPENITIKSGLLRLLHNPEWNETLYMNTCAERLFDEHSVMREQEIMQRILRAIREGKINHSATQKFVTYQINAIFREHQTVTQATTFVAKPVRIENSSENSGGDKC